MLYEILFCIFYLNLLFSIINIAYKYKHIDYENGMPCSTTDGLKQLTIVVIWYVGISKMNNPWRYEVLQIITKYHGISTIVYRIISSNIQVVDVVLKLYQYNKNFEV